MKSKMISITKNIKTEKQDSDNTNEKILNRKEVMEYLGISPSTLYRWCEDNLLTYTKVRRRKLFYKSNVDKLMEEYSSSNLTT